ncbi:MAG: hypothetical protein HRT40_11575 [Campylobacteraceae bacterium]|nr:hypothetical protein [Campylobacteraceae bacterium]
MAKLTKSQRKKVSQQNTANVTLQQQNNTYHLGASEMDALQRMQDTYPHIVDKILSFRQQELDVQNKIINLEHEEQEMRKSELPFIRRYAFLGQFMAYSIGVGSLVGGAYFASIGNDIVSGLFLTSTVGIAFAQFFGKKKETK